MLTSGLLVALFLLPTARNPLVVLDHAGPHAPVMAVAFAPDASALYVGGFDKQVHRYELRAGAFRNPRYVPAGSFRVPIGTGTAGVVNAVAVSPDGKWVAVAGRAPIRGEVWAGAEDGVETKTQFLSPLLKQDVGVVYLFDPADPRNGRVIRGPESEVRAVAFADPSPAAGPVLVTFGNEWDTAGKEFGAVRAFRADTGEPLGDPWVGLPTSFIRPGLVAWADGNGLQVAVSWAGDLARQVSGQLVIGTIPNGQPGQLADGRVLAPLTTRVAGGRVAGLVAAGFDWNQKGRVPAGTIRTLSAGEDRTERLEAPAGHGAVPDAVAALTVSGVGDVTAVLVTVYNWQAKTFTRELRVLTPKGAPVVVPLSGLADRRANLAASPDGRFLAVSGFIDHRVEVYEVPRLLGPGPAPGPDVLGGAAGGFNRIQFLAGNKLWLGGPDESVVKGGVVLDPGTRVAGPNAGGQQVDSAVVAVVGEANRGEKRPGPVPVAAAGLRANVPLRPTVALRDGEEWTDAVLIAGPAWDPALAPVLAVAHTHARSAQTLVTLFDAATGERLLQLDGPTLPVRVLAVSGSRPLLAAAGDDGTAAVWSLRDLRRAPPVIPGLTVSGQDGAVSVSSVEPGSAAAGLFKVGEVIEEFGPAKGDLERVKTTAEFTRAVRAFRPGDPVRVKVAGRAAVPVKLGAGVGHRHPLFDLWVDPRPAAPGAKAGGRDWVAWTAPGLYDAHGRAADRVVLIKATGNPRQPVSFVPLGKLRDAFSWHGFLRHLLDEADLNGAISKAVPKEPLPPELRVSAPPGVREWNGKRLTRTPLASLDVSLSDPDRTLPADGAVLRWWVVGRDGKAGEQRNLDFRGGQVTIPLAGHDWTRGEHTVVFSAHKDADSPAAVQLAYAVTYHPPAPTDLVVSIDGKPVAAGREVVIEADDGAAVEVAITATAKLHPDAAKAGSTKVAFATGPGKENLLPRQARLNPREPDPVTRFRVTATNDGDGAGAGLESAEAEVVVRRARPKEVPPPAVSLAPLPPVEPPARDGEPFLAPGRTAAVRVEVADPDKNPITAVEWNVGVELFGWYVGGADDWWAPVRLDPAGPGPAYAQTRTLELPPGAERKVRVRAKVKNSSFRYAEVAIVDPALPDARIEPRAATVTDPAVVLGGPLTAAGKAAFDLDVVVTSVRTGESRRARVPGAAPPRWESARGAVALFPGENRVALEISNRWKRAATAAVEIRYVRLPAVLAALPVRAGKGRAGDLTVAVATPAGLPPTELRADNEKVGFQAGRVAAVFGAEVWVLKAPGVPVTRPAAPGAKPRPVAVAVRNEDGECRPAAAEVVIEVEEEVRPPAVTMTYQRVAVGTDMQVRTDKARFVFDLGVTSDAPLTRVEVWHGLLTGREKQADGVTAAAAGPGGRKLVASPGLVLDPGVNRVRVVAANAGGTTKADFLVTYDRPSVRVVIETLGEPNGPVVKFDPTAAETRVWPVTGAFVDVTGRVEWDDPLDAVGRGPHLEVVFVANGVAHLPVPVPAPVRAVATGGYSRAFSGRVHLSAMDAQKPGLTQVRVKLRSGSRPGPVQEGRGDAGFTAASKNPLTAQRLHVLIIGLELTEAERAVRVRQLIEGIGGAVPAGNPRFGTDGGEFDRPGFKRATLHRPRIGVVTSGDLNELLERVRADTQDARRRGEDWVNDVILVYYEGQGLLGQGGQRLLHTSSSLQYDKAAETAIRRSAIRMDELPQVPGMVVVVLSTTGSTGSDAAGSVSDLPVLRFSWKDRAAAALLPPEIGAAVKNQGSIGNIFGAVLTAVQDLPGLVDPPTDALTGDARGRVFGFKAP